MGGEGRFRVAEETCRGGSPRKGLLQSAFYYCDNKGNVWKSLFVLVYSSQPIIRESQGRNPGQEPGAGTYTEAMEEGGFLARSPWLAQLTFLYSPGPPAWEGQPLSGLDHPTSIVNQENAHSCPQASLTEVIPQSMFSFSHVTPGCVQLTRSEKEWVSRVLKTPVVGPLLFFFYFFINK